MASVDKVKVGDILYDISGKSAYELAVDNGFIGSEEEWIASLKGKDGKDNVYIGTEEPTDENVKVWINPDGIADGNINSIQYRNILECKETNSTGTSVYWDNIDQAWLYETRRSPYDENRKANYYTIVKEKRDGTRIYTPKSMLDGTDFPIKSGAPYVTCIRRWSNYYLVTLRSSEGNIPSDGVDNSSVWGYLLILNASDLSVAAYQAFNAKCSNVNVVGTFYQQGESQCFIVVSCQMSYFQIIKLIVADDGSVSLSARNKTYFKAFDGTAYEDIHTDIQEFQGAQYCRNSDNTIKLLVSAGFSDGVHIVDVSSIGSTGKYTAIYNYTFIDHLDVVGQDYSAVGISSKAGSTFEVAVDYPYVYCSFAQPTSVIQAYNNGLGDCRVQGLLVLNITDLENIEGKLYKIPLSDCQTDTGSDPKPCSIRKFEDCVYLGMGDKGIARFKVDGMNAEYMGLIKVGKMNCIRYIDVNEHGELFCKDAGYDSSGGVNKFYDTIIDLTSL